MISLLPSRESHITSVLEKYARNVTATHSGTWSFLVSNPSTGQNCPVPNAFPVALHVALQARDFEDAVRASILSGGLAEITGAASVWP